jgi:hypothetical protein
LRPVPPVSTPEKVANEIVRLARRPRRIRRIGALHAISAAYAVAPETTGLLNGRLGRWYFLRAGAPATENEGGLFSSRPAPARTRGGWGEPWRGRSRYLTAGTAGAAAVTAGLVAATRAIRRTR